MVRAEVKPGGAEPSGAEPSGEAFPSWLALVLAVVAFGAGMRLTVRGSPNSVGLGILLLIGGLAFTAVALAQGAYGPDREGPLDLSARLGLGLLGGFLGALSVRLVIWLAARIGFLGLLGIPLASWGDAVFLGLGTAQAVLWGVAFGILYPFVPGSGFPVKGALFGLLAGLYVLLKTLPFDVGSGWLGVDIAPLAFVPVLLFALVWGLACAATIEWGAGAGEAPVSRHLG
jgi:hypothetical protein